MRLLLVDDDAALRALVRATFEGYDIDVEEAENAEQAARTVESKRPDVIVLDVMMPGIDGIEYCRRLKADPETKGIGVVLLSGSDGGSRSAAESAAADAFVPKPFSPLELLAVVEQLAGRVNGVPFRPRRQRGEAGEQLLLYARDLRHMLELERGQRVLLQNAYWETVTALASALETKDTGTRAHSQRVQRYAQELAATVDADLAADDSAGYGFLLHDVGKIGIPDKILLKAGPLTRSERRMMETHTLLGEQMLGEVNFLRGVGLEVVRSHHERWDGGGYPERRTREEIPLGARIFAVADTLDAITSHRPYRRAGAWDSAKAEIVAQAGKQFDPYVVDAFRDCEKRLRAVRREFAAA